MMAIWHMIRQEWRANRMSLFWFTFGMAAMFIIFLSFFEMFSKNAAVLDELLKNFPPEFKAAFGLSDLPLSQINGYIAFIFSYMLLIGAVFGMKIGISALSEEGRSKTSDFLLTKPIQRQQIVTAKVMAAFSLVVFQYVCLSLVFTFALMQSNLNDISYHLLFLLLGALLLVQLFFIGLGSMLAVVLKRIKNPTPLSLGVVFFFFIIELINQSILDKHLAYLTPFAYFKGGALMERGGYDPIFLTIDLAVFLITIILSYVFYIKKDIHAV